MFGHRREADDDRFAEWGDAAYINKVTVAEVKEWIDLKEQFLIFYGTMTSQKNCSASTNDDISITVEQIEKQVRNLKKNIKK